MAFRSEVLVNPRFTGRPGMVLPDEGFHHARATITAWQGYAPTPLVALTGIKGVASVWIKDEGSRFGLGSFKALGGAYAVGQLLVAELARRGVAPAAGCAELADGIYADVTRNLIVTCATDGNHGRSVAWGARRFHCGCVIFVHETVSSRRIDAIAAYGARVVQVAGTYDDAVSAADEAARAQGWFVVSDTSYPGYIDVPCDVMQGYRVMADEAADQWSGPPPTHVFIQAGVGGAAAAVSIQMYMRFSPAPLLVVVEPETAACLMMSARNGIATPVGGDLQTIMAGLACGEPSLLAWQALDRGAFAFQTITDAAAMDEVRALASQGIAIGESGVAGSAGLRAALADEASMAALRLGPTSRVLLFGTEGVTDPTVYRQILRSRQS